MRDTYSDITRQTALQRGAVATGRLTLGSVASSETVANDIGEGRVPDVHPTLSRTILAQQRYAVTMETDAPKC